MYDFIGDVHGHAKELKGLLRKMDYSEVDGVWKHPTRKAIFVGDYIDRGPAIRETLQIVKSMTDAGNAIALIGNHEYNALAYAYQRPDGSYLRSHNEKHLHQHSATLAQFFHYQEEWQQYMTWFYTLHLFTELDGLRVVHACWDEKHIKWLKKNNLQQLTKEFLIAAHQKGSVENAVIEETLKGKEVEIAETWFDKDGHPRKHNRIKWWVAPTETTTYDDAVFNCPDSLKQAIFNATSDPFFYSVDELPVFIGHYWLQADSPMKQSPNVVCLDYSVAKGGSLVAYRWYQGNEIDNKHFVSIKALTGQEAGL